MAAAARSRPGAARGELDDVTLARAQRGDEDAFRELVRRTQQPVFSYVWRMLGVRAERSLVEDLTQDTFVNVHRGLGRFAPGGSARLSTWILTIATRVVLNWLRRPSSRTSLLGEAAQAVVAVGADADTAVIVRDAIERMTPDHRAVLILREYHGFEYQEIAAALDVDVGTVRSRLSRARDALRLVLGGTRPASKETR